MTKLAYDYDSPKNNAAVRLAKAKLPSMIGNHIEDKKARARYREGYAAAQAFGIEVNFETSPDGGHRTLFWSPVHLPVLAEIMKYVDTSGHTFRPDPKDGLIEMFGPRFKDYGAGLVDGRANQDNDVIGDIMEWNLRNGYVPPTDEHESEEICETCYMAQELYNYMTFRAAREGVGHTLTKEFYRNALHGLKGDTRDTGAVSLFGVTFDEQEGILLDDVQNPEAFAIWTLCDDCYARAHQENWEFDAARAAAAD